MSPVQASPGGADWVSISAGYQHSCGIDTLQRISCWGRNDDGQLGDGSTVSTEFPVLVSSSGDLAGLKFQQVSASYTHTCAITVDGIAYCWGKNDQGQLGVPDVSDSKVPLPVDTTGVLGGAVITQIDTGFNHTCALASDVIYCWGGNDDGQIGDGTLGPSQRSPVMVDTSGPLAGKAIKEIGVGSIVTCALDTDGFVSCWGYGREGQMGDGLGTYLNPYPVAVSTAGVLAGKTINHISVGDAGVCAVDVDGVQYCWGLNTSGQLGDGTTISAREPVVVSNTGILASQLPSEISAGGTFGCALTTDGRLSCWGDGSQGQLGNGKSGTGGILYKSTVPVDVIQTGAGVMAGKTIKQLSAGFAHTCVVSTGAKAYCWGMNDYGQLGNGVSTYTATGIPVIVKDPPPVPPTLSDSTPITVQGVIGKTFLDGQAATKMSGYSLRFTVKTGTLPPGVVMNRVTGFLTGTPTTAGTFNFAIAGTNGGGSVSIDQVITVTKAAVVKPTPTTSTIVLEGNIGTSGKANGMSLTSTGRVYGRVHTQYAGPISGKVTVLYRNQTSGNLVKWQCSIKPFGTLKANPKLKLTDSVFPRREYNSLKWCQLPLAARQTLAKEKIQIMVDLHFDRRWPTTYKKVSPTGRKIVPWTYKVTVTAGNGVVL